MLGSSGPQGSCCNANMHCSSPSKRLCTLSTGAALPMVRSIFALRIVRKIHPTVSAAVQDTLLSKQELSACNACSACNPFTASQSSTGAEARRITVTKYHTLYGGHWLPPFGGTSGSPTHCVSCQLFFSGASGASLCWVSCRPCQLYCSSSCSQCQLSCYSHCLHCPLKPGEARLQPRGWKKIGGAGRSCRHIYSLQAKPNT